MSFISDFFEFVYGDINKDVGTGSVMCVFKSLGLSLAFCGGSVISSYLIVTSAFLICCITILPIILIAVYWDGFWGDLGYTYKWLWMAGLIIGACISGLLFLPVWVCLALLIVVLALSLPCGIIFGIGYLIYISCPYCCECLSSCCSGMAECCEECGKGIGRCCDETGECIGECCNGTGECICGCCEGTCNCINSCWYSCNKYTKSTCRCCGNAIYDTGIVCAGGCLMVCANCISCCCKRTVMPEPPPPPPPTGLPPINSNTIIFETTLLPPIDNKTIIFESTYSK